MRMLSYRNGYETGKKIQKEMIRHRIELMKLLPKNPVIAEVGCAEGLFSKDLLDAGAGLLYMIDNWGHIPGVKGDGNFPQEWHDKNYADAMNRVKPYAKIFKPLGEERVVVLKGLSTQMAVHIPDKSLDMVYLDAAHYEDGVIADLKVYYPKVKPGGIIAGHDYLNDDYGVKSAVHYFVNHLIKKGTVLTIPENNARDASFYFEV